jgi:hypothetical protein
MNPHWQSFADDVPWFLTGNERVVVGDVADPGTWRLPNAVARVFPRLADLLATAYTSNVAVGSQPYVLFSWDGDYGPSAWLSPRAARSVAGDLLPAHRDLLAVFGGITERSNEPEATWLLNTNDSLTLEEASHDATFITEYEWAFAEVPGGIPIDLDTYYSISREANGNTTFCHRRHGDVVLFAPDHSFDDVEPLEGCPPYTLYRRRGAGTFVEWVETVAAQWASALDLSS